MADIASSKTKMNTSEVASDAPITEALLTKFGANVNAFIDFFNAAGFSYQEYTSAGNFTFVVPSGVNSVVCFGIGAGGGGGVVAHSGSGAGGGGGGGGMTGLRVVPVTPEQGITVTIGAGGGAGLSGGNTSFGSVVWTGGGGGGSTYTVGTATFGGLGGLGGSNGRNGLSGSNSFQGGPGGYGTVGNYGAGGTGEDQYNNGRTNGNTGYLLVLWLKKS